MLDCTHVEGVGEGYLIEFLVEFVLDRAIDFRGRGGEDEVAAELLRVSVQRAGGGSLARGGLGRRRRTQRRTHGQAGDELHWCI